MKIRTVFALLCLLVVTISLTLGCSQSIYKNVTIPEVTLGQINLHTPDLTGFYDTTSFGDPSFEGYIRVTVIPNDKTVPNQIYHISLFYKGQLLYNTTFSWDANAFIPNWLGEVEYNSNTLVFHFPIPKDHELYTIYFEQYNKPVSERDFNIQDYVYVTITK